MTDHVIKILHAESVAEGSQGLSAIARYPWKDIGSVRTPAGVPEIINYCSGIPSGCDDIFIAFQGYRTACSTPGYLLPRLQRGNIFTIITSGIALRAQPLA